MKFFQSNSTDISNYWEYSLKPRGKYEQKKTINGCTLNDDAETNLLWLHP